MYLLHRTALDTAAPQTDVWLPSVQVMIAREYPRYDCGLTLAAKGGHNNESHNHNDVGSFVVFDNGQPVFIDVGSGTYTAKTFSSERYTLWNVRSLYHNLPFFGEAEQHNGAQFAARAVSCTTDGKKSVLSMDIAGAYPNGAEKWEREISLDREKAEITVKDSFRLTSAERVGFTFMTQQKPELSGGRLILGGGSLSREGFDGSVKTEKITLEDETFKKSFGDSIYRTVFLSKEKMTAGAVKFVYKRG